MPISPLSAGGIAGQISRRILKGSALLPVSRFIITFGLSLTVSELLAFVCGQWTKNDVIPIYPLGGVAGQILRQILKGIT